MLTRFDPRMECTFSTPKVCFSKLIQFILCTQKSPFSSPLKLLLTKWSYYLYLKRTIPHSNRGPLVSEATNLPTAPQILITLLSLLEMFYNVEQYDQIWRNFDKVATILKSLAIICELLTQYLAKC